MNYHFPDVTLSYEPYPFGSTMPGRSFSSNSYRYGFNGYEKDDEVKGNGNHISFNDYGYDPRTGRRWNMDPLWKIFPYQSPYVFALNNPIRFTDEDGEGPGDGVQKLFVTKTKIKVNGQERTVFLKKRFYDNATPALAAASVPLVVTKQNPNH